MIELSGVGHVYSPGTPWSHRALSGIDLSLGAADRVLVVGANGSGKSTLAWILAGILTPNEGTATIDGQAVAETKGVVTIAFQHARLQLFRPTVGEDIRFGATADARTADTALAVVGLDPGRFRDRRVDELSGGEQRRVALAGLLVRRPRMIVLDEPLAGLDAPSRRLFIDVLAHMPVRAGAATVVVSHDVEDADRFADRVIELRDGALVSDRPVR
jgi:energy-coupling factor transport system ATP-binding protein